MTDEKYAYEFIIGTGIDHEPTAVAIATQRLLECVHDVDEVVEATVYDNGGVGLGATSDSGLIAETYYDEDYVYLENFPELESVQEISWVEA